MNWISTRAAFSTINVIAVGCLFYFFREINLFWSVLGSCIVTFLYWCPSIYVAYDVGRQDPSTFDEEMYKDYKQYGIYKILDWFFPLEGRYRKFYDFCWLAIRYGAPMILIAMFCPSFNFTITWCGSLAALSYAIGWVAWEKHNRGEIGDWGIWTTELGEYLSGFFTGFLLSSVGMFL